MPDIVAQQENSGLPPPLVRELIHFAAGGLAAAASRKDAVVFMDGVADRIDDVLDAALAAEERRRPDGWADVGREAFDQPAGPP